MNLLNDDINRIENKFKKELDDITVRVNDYAQVKYKEVSNGYSIRGVSPPHQSAELTIMMHGRFLNYDDMKYKRRHVVIGRLVAEYLFKKENPIGKYIFAGNHSWKVIGVFQDEGGDNEERIAYIPVSTAQMMYGNNDYINQINLGYNRNLSTDAAVAFGKKLEREMRQKLNIHPEDQSALSIRNMAEANKFVSIIMFALYLIIAFIGSGTLIAGIIGISNIMIFVIKERTKEFGIRKALGAKPSSIVGMVVQECILITTLSGYLGLSLGTYILSFIGNSLEKKYFIKEPSVNLEIVILATIILIISGLIAGYIPAKRAASIKPIIALRAD